MNSIYRYNNVKVNFLGGKLLLKGINEQTGDVEFWLNNEGSQILVKDRRPKTKALYRLSQLPVLSGLFVSAFADNANVLLKDVPDGVSSVLLDEPGDVMSDGTLLVHGDDSYYEGERSSSLKTRCIISKGPNFVSVIA